jgi:DNA-binding transcriptional LysR family regulator
MDEAHAGFNTARWVDRHVPNERVVARISNLAFLPDLVRTGMGLALMPIFVGKAEPGLVRVSPPIAELTTKLWMIVHPDLRKRAAVRATMDVAVAMFAQAKPDLMA